MTIYQGDRITVKVTWRNKDGELTNPTSHSIKIYDSANAERYSTVSPDRHISLGVFEVDYDIPEDAPAGQWRCDWEAVIDAGSKMQKAYFTVNPR